MPTMRVPLRPDYAATATSNVRNFWRTLTAEALGKFGEDPAKFAQRHWPDFQTRAAVTPLDRTSTALLSTVIGPFLSGIKMRSAAAQLFSQCLRLELTGLNIRKLPRVATAPTLVFVAEGQPIPVIAASLATVDLGPARKMAMITGLSDELEKYGAGAEEIVRTTIAENAEKSLDPVVFDANPATSLRPAGLLNNVTPIAPTAGGDLAACVRDIQNMVGAIATAGGGSNVWIFASPAQVAGLCKIPNPQYPVVPTPALAANTIVAIEIGAIASGYSGAPRIESSTEATVHWEDTSPAPIGSVGTPATVAAPVRSGWQESQLLLRLILRCAWITRAPGMVQVVNSTTW